MKAITREDQQQRDWENKVISNKHAAARTGTEQPADLSIVFRSLRHPSEANQRNNVWFVGAEAVAD